MTYEAKKKTKKKTTNQIRQTLTFHTNFDGQLLFFFLSLVNKAIRALEKHLKRNQ